MARRVRLMPDDPPRPKPFSPQSAPEALENLRARLRATRWPDTPEDAGWSLGTDLAYLRELVAYWADGFDWPAQEAALARLARFRVPLGGLGIHFVHVRAAAPAGPVLPLVLSHGWPDSFWRYTKVVPLLTDPGAHGADPADAFDVVIPSIPGFGLSGPTHETGWTTARIANAWAELMDRLGYERYGAQGGDWGAFVTPELGRIAPDHVAGVHVNAATFGFIPFGPVDPADLATFSDEEKARFERLNQFMNDGNGYFQLQATRPQTVAYGLTDSPVGQLAWIVEKFKEWSHADETPEAAIDRDLMLTNVMLYWLTRTAGSSGRLYYENVHGSSWGQQPGKTPTGVAVFAEDVAIRRYSENGNNIVQWSEFETGGHFAAMEVPDLLIQDVRTFFRGLR